MKESTKSKIKSTAVEITKEVLWTLSGLTQLIPHPFETKYQHLQRLRRYSRDQITRALSDLSDQDLVKKVKRERKVYYQITDLGRAQSLKFEFQRKPKKVRTNGLSTLVIFDIPEEKSRARRFLRRFLAQNGFIKFQKSVFLGPWELNSDFSHLLKELKVEQNVAIVEGRILHLPN